jgi:hypothetical protein
MTDNQKIHLAEIPPTHCTSCFAQVPLKRHVDFSAYYDGPCSETSRSSAAARS